MAKTIEEVAEKFAELKTVKQAGSSVENGTKSQITHSVRALYAYGTPLSDRLTDAEREGIRFAYKSTKELIAELKDSGLIKILNGQLGIWDIIFGNEFFNENK